MGQWKKEMKKSREIASLSLWIMAQESNAINWEWLFSKGVLRSLRELQIARFDTVFVMWLGDKGIAIC